MGIINRWSGAFDLKSVPWLVLWRIFCCIFSIIPNRAWKLRICMILIISRIVARDISHHYFWSNLTVSRPFVKRIRFRQRQKQRWFATLFQYGLWLNGIRNCTCCSRASSWNRKWLSMWPINWKTLAARNFFWWWSWTWHCGWFADFLNSCIISTSAIPFWFCASLLLIRTYQAMKCIDQVFFGAFLNIFWQWLTPPWRHIEYENFVVYLTSYLLQCYPDWPITMLWPSGGRHIRGTFMWPRIVPSAPTNHWQWIVLEAVW